MAFVIKNSNMYFTQIVDHSSMAGYLDRKHPVKTFEFKSNQNEAMKFKLYLWIVRCRDGFNVQ